MSGSPPDHRGHSALSRRSLLIRLGNLSLLGMVGATVSGCSLPNPRAEVTNLYNQFVGQAQQAAGTVPPPKVLEWITPIPPPQETLARATTGSPEWNQAMGWAQILDQWKAAHPDISLVHHVTSPADLTKTQLAAAKSGNPGDVAYTNWGRILGKAGIVDPLNVGPLARQIVSEAFVPQTAGNQVYAFPIFLSCLGLYLNHQRFQSAKLNPEMPLRDWSTFETAAQKLTDRTKKIYGIDVFGSGSPRSGQMRYGPFLWSAGGSFFDSAGETAIWDQPPGLDAIVYLARLSQNYASPGAAVAPDADLINHWLTGQTATLLSGPELSIQADQKGLPYSVQSVPAYIEGQSSSLMASAGAVGIFSLSRHKDWALGFVQYLASKNAQVAGLKYLRVLPACIEAGDAAPVFQHNPVMGQFLRILREDDIHSFPLAAARNTDVQAVFRVYLGIALRGLSTPEAAWHKSATEATALIKHAKATPTATP